MKLAGIQQILLTSFVVDGYNETFRQDASINSITHVNDVKLFYTELLYL